MIADMLARLRSHMHTYRLYYQSGHYAVTKNEHVAVVQGIARRDPDAAEEAMRIRPDQGSGTDGDLRGKRPGYK